MTFDTPTTQGAHHVGLTVSSLDDTLAFFTEALGFKEVARKPDYPAVFVSDDTLMVTLWQAQDAAPTSFDRKKNVGLHHLALKVASAEALDRLFARVSEHPGVTVEFPPESLGDGPARHAMVHEPSGVRIELICIPGG